MKRVLTYTLALWLFSATFAFAGKIVTPNPSFGQPIRILLQWAIGNQRIAVQTVEHWRQVGPCWEKVFTVYSVWHNHFTHETTVQVDGQVVMQTVCP